MSSVKSFVKQEKIRHFSHTKTFKDSVRTITLKIKKKLKTMYIYVVFDVD